MGLLEKTNELRKLFFSDVAAATLAEVYLRRAKAGIPTNVPLTALEFQSATIALATGAVGELDDMLFPVLATIARHLLEEEAKTPVDDDWNTFIGSMIKPPKEAEHEGLGQTVAGKAEASVPTTARESVEDTLPKEDDCGTSGNNCAPVISGSGTDLVVVGQLDSGKLHQIPRGLHSLASVVIEPCKAIRNQLGRSRPHRKLRENDKEVLDG